MDIFFREVQVAWEELFPFADGVVLKAAERLGLGSSIDDLACLVDDSEFPRLVSALVRVELEDAYRDLAQVRDGRAKGGEVHFDPEQTTRTELYEEARRRNISGRSKMTKDELGEALRTKP